ncbi:hypothetical protein CEXT_269801 [Caerostris extrusa]|uniref:Uncharacterized protein n=1 Tax=Caerostris extrusa TaxID=172846 RepID=A0AAV4PHM2_CAEEX|nr:hypothetical protein CEXT_269801 [Caerostris extrusa]
MRSPSVRLPLHRAGLHREKKYRNTYWVSGNPSMTVRPWGRSSRPWNHPVACPSPPKSSCSLLMYSTADFKVSTLLIFLFFVELGMCCRSVANPMLTSRTLFRSLSFLLATAAGCGLMLLPEDGKCPSWIRLLQRIKSAVSWLRDGGECVVVDEDVLYVRGTGGGGYNVARCAAHEVLWLVGVEESHRCHGHKSL